MSKRELTIKEIASEINQRRVEPVTVRGVRKSIEKLAAEDLVRLQKSVSGRLCTFNTDLFEKHLRASELMLNKRRFYEQFSEDLDASSFDRSHRLNGFVDLLAFLDFFESYWVNDGKHFTVRYSFCFNWMAFLSSKLTFEQSREIEGRHVFVCSSGAFPRARQGGRWENRNVFIRLGAKRMDKGDTIIVNDCVLSIEYSSDLREFLNELFDRAFDEQQITQALKREKGEIVVRVFRSRDLSDRLGSLVEVNYLERLLPSIERFLLQKNSGEQFRLSLDALYANLESVEILTAKENEERIESSEIPWSTNKKRRAVIDTLIDQAVAEEGVDVVVELGVGLNNHAITYARQFRHYIGIDSSPEILARAKGQFQASAIDDQKYQFLRYDFQHFVDHPESVHQEIPENSRVLYLMEGMTWGNFDESLIFSVFRSLLREGDCFVIDCESIEEVSDARNLLPRYLDPINQRFDLTPLHLLGLSPYLDQPVYAFNVETWSVQGKVKINSTPIDLMEAVNNVGFMEGDEVQIFESRKPRREDLKKTMVRLAGNQEVTMFDGSGVDEIYHATLGCRRG